MPLLLMCCWQLTLTPMPAFAWLSSGNAWPLYLYVCIHNASMDINSRYHGCLFTLSEDVLLGGEGCVDGGWSIVHCSGTSE